MGELAAGETLADSAKHALPDDGQEHQSWIGPPDESQSIAVEPPSTAAAASGNDAESGSIAAKAEVSPVDDATPQPAGDLELAVPTGRTTSDGIDVENAAAPGTVGTATSTEAGLLTSEHSGSQAAASPPKESVLGVSDQPLNGTPAHQDGLYDDTSRSGAEQSPVHHMAGVAEAVKDNVSSIATANDDRGTKAEELSMVAVAGIALGAGIVAAAVVSALTVICCRRQRRARTLGCDSGRSLPSVVEDGLPDRAGCGSLKAKQAGGTTFDDTLSGDSFRKTGPARGISALRMSVEGVLRVALPRSSSSSSSRSSSRRATADSTAEIRAHQPTRQ
eukprot:jgi/Tetstr1/434142/TSEL_002466.t1